MGRALMYENFLALSDTILWRSAMPLDCGPLKRHVMSLGGVFVRCELFEK